MEISRCSFFQLMYITSSFNSCLDQNRACSEQLFLWLASKRRFVAQRSYYVIATLISLHSILPFQLLFSISFYLYMSSLFLPYSFQLIEQTYKTLPWRDPLGQTQELEPLAVLPLDSQLYIYIDRVRLKNLIKHQTFRFYNKFPTTKRVTKTEQKFPVLPR